MLPGITSIGRPDSRYRGFEVEYAEVDSSFDPDELRSQLTEIEEVIGRFKTVRGQCSEIRKSRESMEETLDDIEQNITNRLATIEAELTKADGE